jgi:hypothetical protein
MLFQQVQLDPLIEVGLSISHCIGLYGSELWDLSYTLSSLNVSLDVVA